MKKRILIILVVLVGLVLVAGLIVFVKYYIDNEEIKAYNEESNIYNKITPEEIKINESKLKEDLSMDDLRNLNGGYVEIKGQSWAHTDESSYVGDERVPLGIEMRYFNSSVREINGVFSTRKILTANDAAYALMSVRSYLNIKNASFACTEKITTEDKRAFFLQQLYNGVAVSNGGYYIEASKNGTPICVRGGFFLNFTTDIDLEPKISERKALATVKKNMPPNERIEVRRSQLFIYEPDSKDRLVWRFILYDNEDKDYGAIIYVDAMTGKIAKKHMPRIYLGYVEESQKYKEWLKDVDE